MGCCKIGVCIPHDECYDDSNSNSSYENTHLLRDNQDSLDANTHVAIIS
jgi:hypothetical protein